MIILVLLRLIWSLQTKGSFAMIKCYSITEKTQENHLYNTSYLGKPCQSYIQRSDRK